MSETYRALVSDDKLCEAIGRAILACGHLEASMKTLLTERGHIVDLNKKRMLGGLFKLLKRKEFLGCSMEHHLSFLINERNYFIHRIVDYLQDQELQSRDIQNFTNRANGIKDEIDALVAMMSEEEAKAEQVGGADADESV